MTCDDVEKLLPELLDGAPDGIDRAKNAAFQSAFDTHVKSCPDCTDLVSDLKLIAREARHMAATEEPAPRVWVKIAAQLREEGLIREPGAIPARPVLVHTTPRRGWSAWWLAPVAAAVLAASSYVVSHNHAMPVAQQSTATPAASRPEVVAQTPAAAPTRSSSSLTAASTAATATASAPAAHEQAVAQRTAAPEKTLARSLTPPSLALAPSSPRPVVEAEPTAEDRQFLSVVSTRAPSMRASYESQLKAVNADIRETQAYVDRYPGDADARQHLMDSYQQKALLYQIALDRIQ
jgi:hypothetical protein